MIDKSNELEIKSFETSAMNEKKHTISELFDECCVLLCQQNMVKSTSFKLAK